VQGVRVLAQNTSNNKGGGIAFDGKDDYMMIPHQDKQNTDRNSLTIEAWYKPLVQNSFVVLAKKDSANGGFALKYDSASNQLQFIVSNGIDSQLVVVDAPFISFNSFNQITARFMELIV
jgi:predicted outer membrane repeat protein